MSACSSQDEHNLDQSSNNLINSTELIEGKWIDTKGNEQNNENMHRSTPIDYTSSNEYIINSNAYISYYNDGEFIQTNQLIGGVNELPHKLEKVEGANEIIVSVNNEWMETVELVVNNE